MNILISLPNLETIEEQFTGANHKQIKISGQVVLPIFFTRIKQIYPPVKVDSCRHLSQDQEQIKNEPFQMQTVLKEKEVTDLSRLKFFCIHRSASPLPWRNGEGGEMEEVVLVFFPSRKRHWNYIYGNKSRRKSTFALVLIVLISTLATIL